MHPQPRASPARRHAPLTRCREGAPTPSAPADTERRQGPMRGAEQGSKAERQEHRATDGEKGRGRGQGGRRRRGEDHGEETGGGGRRATEGRETGSLGDRPPAKTERQQGAGEERSPEAGAGRGAQGLGAQGPADGSQEATVILSGVADKQGEPLECPTTLRDPDPLDLVGRPRGPTGGGRGSCTSRPWPQEPRHSAPQSRPGRRAPAPS